ncbi:MAG: amino acid kinase family protein [Candidatus Nitrospinota bacterium M3_3B_026]
MRKRARWAVKIGGSLDEDNVLGPLLGVIADLSGVVDMVIIPGGGRFADFVRERGAARRAPDGAAHVQAVLAMAQYGHELASRLPAGKIARDGEGVAAGWRKGCLPVFIPYPFAAEDAGIPHTWEATSDTIAARAAQLLGLTRLVLLKSVDGVMENGRPVPETDAETAARQGLVDPLFGGFIEPWWEVYAINGRAPERLSGLFLKGRAEGTRITPARA